MINVDESSSLIKYKDTMSRIIRMYYPNLNSVEIGKSIDYSINKRFKNSEARLENSYNKRNTKMSLLDLADYINDREPIVTAYGTLFKKHGEVPNPLAKVIQGFLDQRKIHKDKMFTFPKGSEDFEKYNLMQQLDKVDCNAIYGVLGMFSSLVYNQNVATSITSQGRALVSSAGMVFEMFLANNVKFGSMNEICTFIDNVVMEAPKRKYRDKDLIDKDIDVVDCFGKLILTCGYNWIPDENEMDIIWKMLNTLSQEDINRIYYKNNLYEFMSNSSMIKSIRNILNTLEVPYMNPLDPPKEIKAQLDILSDILMEYVYYGYQIIDRILRMDNMIKSVVLISDTDSTFISMDAWYRFILNKVSDIDLPMMHQIFDPLKFYDADEFSDVEDKTFKQAFHFEDIDYDFNFYDDEVIELEHKIDPIKFIPQDNIRYSIINILAYVLDKVINDYMEKFTMNNHSYRGEGKCRIIMKNEFLMKRVLMTYVKKSYASIQEIQEGNIIPKTQKASLDIKGIASMAKSSMAQSTRDALKKIMYEDVLNCEEIDQLKIIKHIAILEKQITKSLYAGSKEFYKPVTVKSMSNYDNPMSIQGIKAIIVWNTIKEDSLTSINLDERNAVDIAKIDLNLTNVEKLKDKDIDLYNRCITLLNNKDFKGTATAIAIPKDINIPSWLLDILDYNSIINDNISGFPLDPIGIMRLGNTNVNYTNILKL